MANNLTPEMLKSVSTYIYETLQEMRDSIEESGITHRTIYDRLYELDLWDNLSIIEEYTKIQEKKSTLPSSIRRSICIIFEAGLAKYMASNKEQKK